MKGASMRLPSLIAVTGVLIAVMATLSAQVHAQQPAPTAAKAVAPVCANCHEEQVEIHRSHAARRAERRGRQHVPGVPRHAAEHLKDPTKFKPANPFGAHGTVQERTDTASTCHAGNRNLAFWTSGKHQINEVTCSNCHSIHGKALAPKINKFVTTFLPNQEDICANCHQPIRAATFKPSHHPIIEGKIKCTDCHNPHGAITPAMLKQPTINDQCYSCHADKRGPYVFNHPPVEENCVTCHNPHGSVHAKLLNESAPNLCQDCHDGSRHPGTVYGAAGGWLCLPGDTSAACNGKTGQPNADVNTRLIARACVNCHNAVHGSNAPGNRGKFFTR